MGVDLTDPRVVAEFKKLQTQRLDELRRKTDPDYDPSKEAELKKQREEEELRKNDEDLTYDE